MGLALTALDAGLSLGHALQASGKRELGPERLMHFQTRVLRPYKLGAGVVETSAIAASAIAAWRARNNRRAALLTSTAVVANIAAFAVWAAGIQPVNKQLSVWTADTTDDSAPADWEVLRDRWHRLHMVRLALLSTATGALTAAP